MYVYVYIRYCKYKCLSVQDSTDKINNHKFKNENYSQFENKAFSLNQNKK